MKYVINGELLTINLGSKEGPKNRHLSLEGVLQNLALIEKLCFRLCAYGQGKANYTQSAYISSFLSPLIAYLRFRAQSDPLSSGEWQDLITDFMSFYLCSTIWSRGSAQTRIENWQSRVYPIIHLLIEDEVIPLGLYIPKIRVKNEVTRRPLKQIINTRLKYEHSNNDVIDKLLIDTNFSNSDDDFLLNIEKECRSKIEKLKEVCLAHWKAMLHDQALGQKYADKIPKTIVAGLLCASGVQIHGSQDRYNLVCSPTRNDGHLWAFALIKFLLDNSDDVNCISVRSLRKLPYYKHNALKTRDYEHILINQTALNEYAFKFLSTSMYMYHFSGVLSGIDVAAICTLLIIDHPIFNPLSLANAKLLDVRGKSFLITTDTNNRMIFSVDKPRARARKIAVLTNMAQEIISEVVRMTSPIRRILKNNGDPNWRYLFLGQQMGGTLGPIRTTLTDCLTCNKARSLVRMYPALSDFGLKRGTLDFSKIRNTMGVIKWFETGSIREMSKLLGNSTRVVLENYLPPSLVVAWNTRIIRRFQNTLIILAAAEEDYILEVTDFSSLSDLLHFVSQLVFEYKKGTSPIADRVQELLPGMINSSNKTNHNKIVNIRLCPKALSYLYAFHHYAINNIPSAKWNITDYGTGLSVQQLVDTAVLLKHASENDDLSPALREILEYETLKRIHKKALVLEDKLSSQFNKFSISNKLLEQH